MSAAGYTKLLTKNISYKPSTTSYDNEMFSLSMMNPKQTSKLKSAPQIGRERLSYHGTKHSTTLKFQKKDDLGLQCKAVFCSWSVSRWKTIKQDRDVDHQFWTSTQEETTKFLKKSFAERRKILRRNKTTFFKCRRGKDYVKKCI